MAVRKKKVGRARAALSSIYKRMAAVGHAGMARIKKMRNRTGYDHLQSDEADFAYIEKEANDILAAIARLRARDAGEYMPEEAFYGPTAPSEAAEFYEPVPETQHEIYEPIPETQHEIYEAVPETQRGVVSNMTRGRRRRNRTGGEYFFSSPVYLDEIKLNRQGYTSTGRYYGVGGKLFTAYNTAMDFHVELRAKDRKEAMAKLMAKYPGITFKKHSKKEYD